MRKAIIPALAFALGVSAVTTVLEAVHSVEAVNSISHKLNIRTVFDLLLFGAILAPGAWLGFVQLRQRNISAASAAVLGATIGVLNLILIEGISQAHLGWLGGLLWVLGAPAAVAWLGGGALGRREAHG